VLNDEDATAWDITSTTLSEHELSVNHTPYFSGPFNTTGFPGRAVVPGHAFNSKPACAAYFAILKSR
jgi:hypothetical protein